MIYLNSPIKPDLRKVYGLLEKVNKNGWFTNFGPLHNELTEKLEEYLGVKHLLLTNNGTSALQVAGRSIGSQSLISTPFSFVATVSAFKSQKDNIIFSDIDAETYNLCPKALNNAYKKGCNADTILATHVYGNPCDVHNINLISRKNNTKIIYDAAHAFGVKLNDESILNHGDASVLSFHATKIFHTIEGGAIIFKEKQNYDRAKEIINFGINPERGVVNVGTNAKMNEYQAAVGIVNLDSMDNILEHRCEIFDRYRQELKNYVGLQCWESGTVSNGSYMPILLKDREQREKVFEELNNHNIQSRHYFSPSLDEIFLDSYSYGASNSSKISENVLCLPMHANLSLQDVDTVVNTVKMVL